MRTTLFIIILSVLQAFAFGQTKGISYRGDLKKPGKSGVTRAIVVGISDYQNDNIPDLRFAHRDAEIFAEYLRESNPSIDKNNIKLLTNEKATSGQFVSELYWLMEESQEGDEAIIYFSGHGDVESTLRSQPGFLLFWDAPSKVYMGGGTFGLTYLREIIATISTEKNAKVTVITDACRSGKLAGNGIEGTRTTALSLSQQYANEVKIMSCQPNEFALESESWGEGRGIFSYFLIAGLKGLADQNNDNDVDLREIQRYLEDNVSEAAAPHSQFPMTVGDRTTIIAMTNDDLKTQAKAELGDIGLEEVKTRAGSIVGMEADSNMIQKLNLLDKAIEDDRLLYPENESAYHYYMELCEMEEFQTLKGLYTRNLAAALQDDAQQAINKYLAADYEELSRRLKFDTTYSVYPEYLSKAAGLLGKNHFYYNTLLSRAYYFTGLEMRLQGEYQNDTTLIKQSLIWQDSCLTLDSLAAFAINEKGYANYLLGNYDTAVDLYQKTLTITPTWQLVWSNLSQVYVGMKNYSKAINAGENALKIDSTYSTVLLNLGTCYYYLDDSAKMKNYYNEIIENDPSFSDVYSVLAVYEDKNGNFKKALEYKLKEYEIDSTNRNVNLNLGHLFMKLNNFKKAKFHFEKEIELFPYYPESYQGMIEFSFYTKDWDTAIELLTNYIQKFPSDGFAMYLLSSSNAALGNNKESIKNLENAISFGFSEKEILLSDENFKDLLEQNEFKTIINQIN